MYTKSRMSASAPTSWTWPTPFTLSAMTGYRRSCTSLAVLRGSSLCSGSSMIACLLECKMMLSCHSHSQWQMVSSRVVWCYHPILHDVLSHADWWSSVMVILEFPLGTSLMGSSSTFRDCKQKPLCRLMSSMTFPSQMTVHLMLEPSSKCRRVWICSL